VVGYDGSDSARRAVARGVRAAGPRGQVMVVTVEPKLHEDGIVAEQLLIVVGRTGKSFLARAILGSVAVRVVELARCDVLVVA
jgi:nucleotide-binding universal stress UspA family protein